MNTFRHFLLTRFNIPFNPFEMGNIDFLFDEKYLTERFTIFEKYCLPSVINQSNQNFIWIVLFDSRTPQKFKNRNKIISEKYDKYKPIYINFELLITEKNSDQKYYNEVLRIGKINNKEYSSQIDIKENFFQLIVIKHIASIFNQFTNHEEFLITTRLDNDDALHKDMIDKIQKLHQKQHKESLICFDNGIQYIANTNIAQTFFYPNNHFTTYIEKLSSNPFTILFWEHYFISKVKDVQHITDIPLWIEIIHKKNAVNSFQFTKKNKLILSCSLYNFGFKFKYNTMQCICSILLSPSFYLIPKIKYKLKKILAR